MIVYWPSDAYKFGKLSIHILFQLQYAIESECEPKIFHSNYKSMHVFFIISNIDNEYLTG